MLLYQVASEDLQISQHNTVTQTFRQDLDTILQPTYLTVCKLFPLCNKPQLTQPLKILNRIKSLIMAVCWCHGKALGTNVRIVNSDLAFSYIISLRIWHLFTGLGHPLMTFSPYHPPIYPFSFLSCDISKKTEETEQKNLKNCLLLKKLRLLFDSLFNCINSIQTKKRTQTCLKDSQQKEKDPLKCRFFIVSHSMGQIRCINCSYYNQTDFFLL